MRKYGQANRKTRRKKINKMSKSELQDFIVRLREEGHQASKVYQAAVTHSLSIVNFGSAT